MTVKQYNFLIDIRLKHAKFILDFGSAHFAIYAVTFYFASVYEYIVNRTNV